MMNMAGRHAGKKRRQRTQTNRSNEGGGVEGRILGCSGGSNDISFSWNEAKMFGKTHLIKENNWGNTKKETRKWHLTRSRGATPGVNSLSGPSQVKY